MCAYSQSPPLIKIRDAHAQRHIAYISTVGLWAVGRKLVIRTLRHTRLLPRFTLATLKGNDLTSDVSEGRVSTGCATDWLGQLGVGGGGKDI